MIMRIICAQFWLVYDILASHSSSHVFLLSEQIPSHWYLCVILCPHGPSPLSPSSLSLCLPKDHLHLSISIPRVTMSSVSCVKVVVPNPLVTKCAKPPSPLVLILKKYAALCPEGPVVQPAKATCGGEARWGGWGGVG